MTRSRHGPCHRRLVQQAKALRGPPPRDGRNAISNPRSSSVTGSLTVLNVRSASRSEVSPQQRRAIARRASVINLDSEGFFHDTIFSRHRSCYGRFVRHRAVYADRLAKRGYDLILVARNGEKLKALATRLVSETGRSVKVLPADLGDKAALAKVEAVLQDDESITMLVNNAGTASLAPLVDSDVDQMEAMITLNVTALTRLTYAAAPAFVARGAGTIINIGSVVGIAPERLNGVYGAGKAYVLALTHSLQHELAGKGVRVQAVLPAATATDIWEKGGFHHSKLPAGTVMSTADMVDAAMAGLDQGEMVTIPPLQDGDDWTRFEASRRALAQKFGNSAPAPRYRVAETTRKTA